MLFKNVFKVKKYFAFCIVSVSLFIYVLTVNYSTKTYLSKITKSENNLSENQFVNKQIEDLLSRNKQKPKCNIPFDVGAFDDYVKPYLKPNLRLNCTKRKEFTYVDYANGLLKLSNDRYMKKWKCFYSFITRGSSDQQVKHTKPAAIPKSGVKFSMKNYVANVTCYEKQGNKKIVKYSNTHLWIPNFRKTKAKGPNVFILVIESLSRNSYLRFMKQTQLTLRQLKYFTELKGLTKVASNSFPNSMALIAGNAVNNATYTEWNDYWDKKLNYLWDRYKQKGYVSAFVEDFVKIGLFDYLKKGFKMPPTDFFPRSFWLQQYVNKWDLYDAMENWKNYCLGEQGSRVEVFLSHLYQFVKKMEIQKQPYFMYAFYSQITHEDFNNFQLVDEFVASFLLKMSKYLPNTVFLLMGDHGPRFGPMTDTPLGKLESRLPFAALRIPESLNEKFPHLRNVLQLNEKSLLSWFDIHKLFLDISNGIYDFEAKSMLSILNPCRHLVSPERNCVHAQIPLFFCVCDNHFQVDPKFGWHEWYAGEALIKIVNSWINKTCDAFTFDSNKYAEVYLPPKNETLSLFERVNVTASTKNVTVLISAVMKRTAKDMQSAWSEWQIDAEFTDAEKLKNYVLQNYCFHNLTEIVRTKRKKTFKTITTKARKKSSKKA